MNDISFGEWLCRQRKSMGMTQQQLAQQINCATITVRKIEAQQRRPSVQVADQMTRVLNIPPKEHEAFLHFARGDGHSAALYSREPYPWRVSPDPSKTSSLPISIPVQGSWPADLPGSAFYLDSISDRYSQVRSQASLNALITPQGVQGTIPGVPEAAYIALMIPISMLNQAVLSVIQSLQLMIRDEAVLEGSTVPFDILTLLSGMDLSHPGRSIPGL